jgi:hypothetical protein
VTRAVTDFTEEHEYLMSACVTLTEAALLGYTLGYASGFGIERGKDFGQQARAMRYANNAKTAPKSGLSGLSRLATVSNWWGGKV